MKAAIFIRIASVLLLLHAALHTVGGVFGKVAPGPASVAVAAMQANHFVAFGNLRTYWDFYMGFGLGISIFLAVEGLALWTLAPLAAIHGTRLRPALAIFALGYVVFAVNSFRYFFIAPVIMELLIAACLVAAIATLPREGNPRTSA